MLNSKFLARCGHPGNHHKYRVESFYSGNFSVLRCGYTLCRQRLVISHEMTVELVAR